MRCIFTQTDAFFGSVHTFWDIWTRARTWPPRSARTIGRFFLAWGLLNAVPFLPALLTPLPLSPYFPLCVEVLVLVSVLALAGGTRIETAAQVISIGGVAGLVLYETYDAAVYTAFRRSGILYEDVQFLDDLFYFVVGVGSWRTVGLAVLGVLGGVGVILLVRKAARVVTEAGQSAVPRWLLLGVHLVAWPLVGLIGPAQDWGTPNLTYQNSSDQVRFRTITTKAIGNARTSLRLEAMMDSLGDGPADSTYAAYDTLSLHRRPSVYLFAVESYGTVLNRHPELRGPYRALMTATDSALQADGWHGVTARLEAPVRGGRSWLAIASLLTGVRVDRQVLYNRFLEAPGTVPHLVNFLDRRGYHTVALQPYTFARPGLPVRNMYDFDSTIYRNDLGYQGPAYGLANAPDQYSLNVAHQQELGNASTPFFLFFETVSSHALWNYGLAPYLSDWRDFNTVSGTDAEKKRRLQRLGTPSTPLLPDSITAPRIYDQPRPQRYLQHIAYDLHVLRRYLAEKAPDGSLVFILGDHQPPLLETESSAVPLHVLSTDVRLLDRLRGRGFTEGLRPTREGVTLRHEELYSLLVQLLARERDTAGADRQSPSLFRPGGGPPSLLVE